MWNIKKYTAMAVLGVGVACAATPASAFCGGGYGFAPIAFGYSGGGYGGCGGGYGFAGYGGCGGYGSYGYVPVYGGGCGGGYGFAGYGGCGGGYGGYGGYGYGASYGGCGGYGYAPVYGYGGGCGYGGGYGGGYGAFGFASRRSLVSYAAFRPRYYRPFAYAAYIRPYHRHLYASVRGVRYSTNFSMRRHFAHHVHNVRVAHVGQSERKG
jgi:hypothetical protein